MQLIESLTFEKMKLAAPWVGVPDDCIASSLGVSLFLLRDLVSQEWMMLMCFSFWCKM